MPHIYIYIYIDLCIVDDLVLEYAPNCFSVDIVYLQKLFELYGCNVHMPKIYVMHIS